MQLSIVITSRGKLIEETFADRLIRLAIASPQGRARLAQSMIAPIKRNLDYQGIARRALVIEQLPLQGLHIIEKKDKE